VPYSGIVGCKENLSRQQSLSRKKLGVGSGDVHLSGSGGSLPFSYPQLLTAQTQRVPSHRNRTRRDEDNFAAEPTKSRDIVHKCREPGLLYRATIPIDNEIRTDLYNETPSRSDRWCSCNGARNHLIVTPPGRGRTLVSQKRAVFEGIVRHVTVHRG